MAEGFKTNPIMILVSTEMLEQAEAMRESLDRYMSATPEERATWAREAKAKRAVERENAQMIPLDLAGLVRRLGWTEEYATHFMQPYCTCGDSYDGWDFCEHARDLGLDS